MAFGEFGDRSETPVGNEKEAETLKAYSDLKRSLATARDIPNHQLSNERLRHALLGECLHQNKVRAESDLGWLWNTLGVCGVVATLVFALGRFREAPNPTLNLKGLDQVANKDFQFGGEITPIKAVSKQKPSLPATAISSYRVAEYPGPSTHTARTGRSHRKVSILKDPAADPNLMVARFSPVDSFDDGSYPASDDSPSGSPMRNAILETPAKPRVEEKKPGQDSVVEIEQDQDDNTGARAAREIAGKNLLVGG
jgi:hypothetical protein